jgi:3',5'-cyclic AMP phosphodiesterase CpdA
MKHHRKLETIRTFFCIVLLVFLSAFPAGAVDDEPIRIAVISDLNGSYGSSRYNPRIAKAMERIAIIDPDIVISTGDHVAGQQRRPLLERDRLEAMWQSFHGHVSEPLEGAGLDLAVTPGNHDASGERAFQLEREVYREQWQPRRPDVRFIDEADYPFNYAFAIRDVLFISLDVTMVGPLSTRQKTWLSDLLVQHANAYRHRIVFSHVPLWPFAIGRETEIIGDEELEEMLQEHRIDAYLSGHHHAYYPGFKDGIRYISQACLGSGPRALIGTKERSGQSFTVLTLSGDGSIEIEAYGGPDFTELTEVRALPEKIISRRATLIREDIAAETETLTGRALSGSPKP